LLNSLVWYSGVGIESQRFGIWSSGFGGGELWFTVYGLWVMGYGFFFRAEFWVLHSRKIGVWDSGKMQIIAGVIQF